MYFSYCILIKRTNFTTVLIIDICCKLNYFILLKLLHIYTKRHRTELRNAIERGAVLIHLTNPMLAIRGILLQLSLSHLQSTN